MLSIASSPLQLFFIVSAGGSVVAILGKENHQSFFCLLPSITLSLRQIMAANYLHLVEELAVERSLYKYSINPGNFGNVRMCVSALVMHIRMLTQGRITEPSKLSAYCS